MSKVALKWGIVLVLAGVGLGVASWRTQKSPVDLVFPPRRIKKSVVPKIPDLPPRQQVEIRSLSPTPMVQISPQKG